MQLSAELTKLANAIHQQGGQPILVGGSVRDYLLGQLLPKDLDLEVYRLEANELEGVLSQFGKVLRVGKSFGVLKLITQHAEYDVSLPRRESKTGKGHKGFLVNADPQMTFEEASARRDFTVNSIGFDPIQQLWLDPHLGQEDLKKGILRHVGPAFAEDPLRVLRGAQFAARLNFQLAPETIELCKTLDLNELSRERLLGEFKKLLLRPERPSIGLEILRQTKALRFFPELEALIDVPQDPTWHPEGCVWSHTLMVVDEASRLRVGEEKADLVLMFGALCHDFGKPETTIWKDGHWRSPAHDFLGMQPTEKFLRRLTDEASLIEKVTVLVREHLRPSMLYNDREKVTPGAIRRLALRISIPELLRVAEADHFGRTTEDALRREFPAKQWLLNQASQLDVRDEKPKPFLKGRHLLQLGMRPGPQMGKVLEEAFVLQLDGAIVNLEEAKAWANQRLNS
ncbi:MAG: polynucleotide adenylyltransferase [Deltaproteobacteria bacterium]|nr:polynucleotide adenylyltransferase [Deltaproteobacteria bacterium]